MAENRKQHFVPQFYLRNFSPNGTHICCYNLDSTNSYLTQIRTSCQERYFYGKDPQIEKILAPIEKKQSDVLRKIIKDNCISNISDEDYLFLQSFITLQFVRTKDAKENFNKMTQHIVEHGIKPMMKSSEDLKSKGITDEFIDSLKITHSGVHGYAIFAALRGVDMISDLKPILLHNSTENEFITSDTPVVKNNYLHLKNIPLTGFMSPGLQIFVPLNSNLCLLFIDEIPYHLRGGDEQLIEINKEPDIMNINTLQLLNCQENSFFSNHDDTYVKLLHNQVKGIRQEKQFRVQTIDKQLNPDGSSEEIETFQISGMNYRRKFSFIKLNHEYNRQFKSKVKRVKKIQGFVRPVRNKEHAERIKNEIDEEFQRKKQHYKSDY